MVSKNKMKTKYTFKGSKTENKYSNIFQDLIDKQGVFNENSLKKIHKSDSETTEEQSLEDKFSIKTVTPEEAKENSLKRRQASMNEQIIATRKSSPVVSNKITPDFDRVKSIEKLKREKRESKLDDDGSSGVDLEELANQNTIEFDSLGDITDVEQLLNNRNTIREVARERAAMDKSNVEIYKEYSDFERSSYYDNDKKTQKFDVVDDHAVTYEEEIKKREGEIEELIRLMKSGEKPGKTSRVSRKALKNSKKDNDKKVEEKALKNESLIKGASFRNDVYKKNSQKNEPRINFKKMGLVLVVALLIILFIAAAIDKFFSNKNEISKSTTTTKTTTTSSDSTKTADKSKTASTETKEEKIKKIEAIRPKLSINEAERLDYIIENIDSYPNEFINLLARNPETVDYVYSYKDKDKYNNKALSSNISSSYYVDGSVPLFLQWDRRWGYRQYGKEMIGLSGCGPTSLAMVIRHFDSSSGVNPYDVAKYSQESGYVSDDNYTSWSLFEKGLSKYGLTSKDIVPVEAKMKKALDDGQILIVSVNPGIFTERGHIIVIKGYNKNGDFLINDPNSIVNTNKSWSFDELKDQIRKIWGVSSTSSKSKEESKSSETTSNSSSSSEDPSIIQDIN